MTTITIEMPTTLVNVSRAYYAEYRITSDEPQNRTRIVANEFLDYLKTNEEFLPCTYSEDGATCYMHLKLVRANKSHCNVLDELKERGIITRYAH